MFLIGTLPLNDTIDDGIDDIIIDDNDDNRRISTDTAYDSIANEFNSRCVVLVVYNTMIIYTEILYFHV